MLSLLLSALAAPVPPPCPIAPTERVINTASELVPWCRDEAEAHFAGQGIPTYQWSANYRDEGRLLVVEGTLRADGRDVAVRCRIARGARERHGTVEIDPPR